MRVDKKQFLGDKSLRHFVVPAGTTEIGDWAFAGCKELIWVAIPDSVMSIGREVFANCDKLASVYWYQGNGNSDQTTQSLPDKEDPLANLMAYAFRFFKWDDRLFLNRKKGMMEWLALWDEACIRYLDTADSDGFRPFLAGGEEDYVDEKDHLESYCKKVRYQKARVILSRLMVGKKDESISCFKKKFLENDRVLTLLTEKWDHPGQVIKIYEELGLLTPENCRMLLMEIPAERVEMRAILLQKVGNTGTEEWLL